jgi:hypothetical protein
VSAPRHYQLVELGAVSRAKARAFLSRYAQGSEETLAINVDRLTEVLASLSYREAMNVLKAAELDSSFSREDLIRVAIEHVDATLAKDFWRILRDIPVGSRELVLGLLNGLAVPPNDRGPLGGRNPIEQLFARLKAFLRKMKARTVEELWRAIASFLKDVSKEECKAYLANSRYT